MIELGDREFMSQMSDEILDIIQDKIFMKGEDTTLEEISDYSDFGLGDVAIYNVKKKGRVEKWAYGQFGRIILGHIDTKTWEYVNSYYDWPSRQEDYSWFLCVALYNRNYVKYGKPYLDYVQDAILTNLSNMIENAPQDVIYKKKLKNHIVNVFTDMRASYAQLLDVVGDSILPGEEQKVMEHIVIISNEPNHDM